MRTNKGGAKMNKKLLITIVCLFIVSLLIVGCSRIASVERVNSFGFPGMAQANARPGYDILLIDINTTAEDISSLVLTDKAGNQYPSMGLFDSKYIFEVRESAQGLTLVINNKTRVPLP
jgi:hypothetical protein